jgi:hypothetical protein
MQLYLEVIPLCYRGDKIFGRIMGSRYKNYWVENIHNFTSCVGTSDEIMQD